MARNNGSTIKGERVQRSKRDRYTTHNEGVGADLDLMVRFNMSRDRDRQGTGR